MKTKKYLLPIILCMMLLCIARIEAQFSHFSEYMYVSHAEVTRFDEIIWWWDADTFEGRFHTNGSIPVRDGAELIGTFYTGDGPPFQQIGITGDIYYYWPQIVFPDELNDLREAAEEQGNFFANEESLYQFRCQADETGWIVRNWLEGVPWDSTIVIDSVNIPYGDEVAIFVDGGLQLFGENVSGQTTIGASGNIFLMDNILYSELEPGDVEEEINWDDVESSLGIASEKDIRIANTWPNGRGNGAVEAEPGDHSRQHIVITASLLALEENFTFENQNDVWDTYIWCTGDHVGETDERGTIFFRGSLANYRRGYVHRSNCGGTGYAKNYLYDPRLEDNPIPHFPEIDWYGTPLFGDHTWSDTSITLSWENLPVHVAGGSLTLGPNLDIEVNQEDPPFIWYIIYYLSYADFRIDAEQDYPVSLSLENFPDGYSVAFVHELELGDYSGIAADSLWSGLNITGNEFNVVVDGFMQDCSFTGDEFIIYPARNSSRISIENCVLDVDSIICSDDGINSNWNSINRTVVNGKLCSRFDELDRLSFGPGLGKVLENLRPDAQIRNSFFMDPITLLVSGSPISVDYCGYGERGNETVFGDSVQVGEHILVEVDPLFVDWENGDFRLMPDSPLIDAGDPDSDPDPDGTVADIGAFYFDQLDVEEFSERIIPSDYSISPVFPNPFNGVTNINIELPIESNVRFEVFNLLGQNVSRGVKQELSAGLNKLSINLAGFPAGIYFVKVSTGDFVRIQKAVLLK